jgi:alpha/beta superfamily hydrolase
MRPATRRETVRGPAGGIECAVDEPQGEARGVALIAHPHPLYGGTLDNKVVQTLGRALVELGYATWRPNFRGVGRSEGAYDEGRGEVDDLAAVLAHLDAKRPVLAGFSFGAAMQAKLAARVAPERMVLVGIAVNHFEAPAVPTDTLLIHGENDDTVPIAAVRGWAEPQGLGLIVVPGADHFFHHKLPDLRSAVTEHWK